MHLDPAPDVPSKPSRRVNRDREPAHRDPQRVPAPTDLAERMIAFQRRTAASTRPRERAERQPPHPNPRPPEKSPIPSPSISPSRVVLTSPRKPNQNSHTPKPDADPDDFSRRLRISSSPVPRTSPPSKIHTLKLFNPGTDPIPMRQVAEPEPISDGASSSGVPRSGPKGAMRDTPARQLFDHRKDDPVRFAVLARPQGRTAPTPKSSADYLSASSTSSYANSVTSSNFTLSSNTDDSSASSALFDRQGKPNEGPGTNIFAVQLKKLYRTISTLEEKVKQEDADEASEEGKFMLKGKEVADDDLEREKWKKQIDNHKRLAETIQSLLEISLAPSVPASLRNIPTKYNIIIRLWTYAFHKLLESFRRASFTSPLALEHLQDFIYYAYTFYTGLLEEPTLATFKSGWLEALGDLARYRMAVSAMVTGSSGTGPALTADAVSQVASATSTSVITPDITKAKANSSGSKSLSDVPAARIGDAESPSVGLAAARLLDIEPEKERWRHVARDWYAAGLADTPGTGKLHHHLGLLSREIDGEELRGVYHFTRSMTTLHPFMTSRESVLPLWSAPAQARRSHPDTRAPELFILLHGMLFTNIQLDDFQPTLARFVERLEIEGAEEREWAMMAVINICSVLEYGKPGAVLKKNGAVGSRCDGSTGSIGVRVVARRMVEEERMDVDGDFINNSIQTSPSISLPDGADDSELPTSFKLALQLTFAMLTHVLQRPTRKASPFLRSTLNPYVTIMLTFLTILLKHPATLEVLQRSVPWAALAQFLATIPRNVISSQMQGYIPGGWTMLTSGCAPPLPEDWCLRGMEWVGRRVYERGFWKSGEDRKPEMEMLCKSEACEVTDGIIEDGEDDDDDGDRQSQQTSKKTDNERRWTRVFRCGVGIADLVDGFTWVEGTREWKVEGSLKSKVELWKEEDRVEREEEEKRRMGRRWTEDSMEIDEHDAEGVTSEESEDDEGDSDEIKALKERRQYLRSLLQSTQRGSTTSSPPPRSPPVRPPRSRVPHKPAARSALSIVPGYTILVVDTNILLSSLSIFASLVESLRWTVVVPLPVIMELDGLSSNASQLGEAARAASAYVTSHIRSHSTSLKIQTSKGNYLTTLSVRTEQVELDDRRSHEQNMDDLILKAAIWQDDHWADRSGMLKDGGYRTGDVSGQAVKVMLLSLDRNLRLKARSRQLPAANQNDLAFIFAAGT